FIDGVADTTLQVGVAQSLVGGSLAELSAGVYQLTWSTGQQLTITDQGGYLDWTVALGPHDGPGSVRGLLGSNSGPGTDFQLPNGTLLGQPSADQLLGEFAEAWRVPADASLFTQAMAGELVSAGIASQNPTAPVQEPASTGMLYSPLHA